MPHINDPLLQAYIDGFCSPERVDEVEAHVATCAECAARLEAARGAAQRASELLGSLDPGPVHAPSFEELEARAAARQGGAVGDGLSGDTGAGKSPARVVPFWRRPGLAWAATLVIAFGLGWLSRAPSVVSPDAFAPEAASVDALESRLSTAEQEEGGEQVGGVEQEAGAAGRDAGVAGQDPGALGRGAATEDREAGPAGARESFGATTESDVVDDPQAIPKSKVAAPERRVAASDPEIPATPPVAEPDPPQRQMMARNQAAPPDSEEQRRRLAEELIAAAPPVEEPERPAATVPGEAVAEMNEAVAGFSATFADAGAAPGFVPIAVGDAELWLGVPPRQLPDLTLTRVEVGPGALAENGMPDRAAVRLVYHDAAGQQIALLQQYAGVVEPRASTLGDEAGAGASADTVGGSGAVASGVASAADARAAQARSERARAVGAYRADAKASADRDGVVGGALDLPAIVQQPGGPTTYRWIDAEGYVLAITGDLDLQLLRGLADRIR